MIKIANAPCSWGVIENIEGERGGYVRVLDEMQATGYAGTELGDWGFMPTDPAQLRQELAARQLQLLASWVSARLYDAKYHEAGVETAVRTAHLLAEVGGPNSLIVLGDDHSTVPTRHDNAGRIQPEHGLSAAEWEIYSSGANCIARAVRQETGLRTAFHHHAATFVETPTEIDTFLSLTDSDVLGLCFDSGHCALGGGDPVDLLTRHANRIWHVHFKDFDPTILEKAKVEGWTYTDMVGQGIFCELGQGNVDFPAVLATLNKLQYDGWIVVEQDVLPSMGSPKESANRNRAFLRSIGL
ncbi:Inosose dehydratase [hydrothermal vent metagenome]|uniref:Inosose dehydratase n=1 Tax=hydrothermal vent metagenome TaxID=652676 RepID=A0A3B0V3R4_9ZZZZ